MLKPSNKKPIITPTTTNKKQEPKVDRDAYFIMTAKMSDGFSYEIPCRGYNLNSWKKFEESLNNTYEIKEVNRAEYEIKLYGQELKDDGEKYEPTTSSAKSTGNKRKRS